MNRQYPPRRVVRVKFFVDEKDGQEDIVGENVNRRLAYVALVSGRWGHKVNTKVIL